MKIKQYTLICLLAIVISGTLVLGSIQRNPNLAKTLNREGLSNMTYIEQNQDSSDNVEVNGIRFETVMPERVLTIPDKKTRYQSLAPLGIRITNNTQNPWYFTFLFAYKPQLKVGNQLEEPGFMSDRMLRPRFDDFLLARPGETVTFFLPTSIQVIPETLNTPHPKCAIGIQFRNEDDFDVFTGLTQGTYQIRFTYGVDSWMAKDYQKWVDPGFLNLDNLWLGQVTTPFVEFKILNPENSTT